jgi:hypothetical protein
MSRFKNFCPRCEEVYVPKARQVNIDGAAFGTSFPHVFLKHYPMAVILPPKIYHYEPKIYGFKMAGKRGSKFFQPPKGNVRIVEESMQGLELEKILKQQAANQLNDDFERLCKVEKEEDQEANEVNPPEGNRQGKRNRKKNKNKK